MLEQSDLDSFYPVPCDRVDYSNIWACKEPFFKKAFQTFLKLQEEEAPLAVEFKKFKRKHNHWLNDYSLFMALKRILTVNHGMNGQKNSVALRTN